MAGALVHCTTCCYATATALHGWRRRRQGQERLTETDEEGMTLCTVQRPQLVQVIVTVVARLSIGQRGVGGVDGVDQLAESDPLDETEDDAPLGRLDLSICRIVGLVELAQVDAVVARRHTYVVRAADVVLQLDVAAFSHGFDGSFDFVDGLTKCRPSTA